MNNVAFNGNILLFVLSLLFYYLYLVYEFFKDMQLIIIKKILTRAWGESRQSPLSIFPRRALRNDGRDMQAANEIRFHIGLVMIFGFLCVKGDHRGLQPLAGEGRMLISLFLQTSSIDLLRCISQG